MQQEKTQLKTDADKLVALQSSGHIKEAVAFAIRKMDSVESAIQIFRKAGMTEAADGVAKISLYVDLKHFDGYANRLAHSKGISEIAEILRSRKAAQKPADLVQLEGAKKDEVLGVLASIFPDDVKKLAPLLR